jgi:two-component system, response regulator YesN
MYRVLIVDDEEPVLDSYAFLLESEGADFVLAGKARSGFEAIQAIHELRPDVVFMDINMPGMDGIQVIAEVHLTASPARYSCSPPPTSASTWPSGPYLGHFLLPGKAGIQEDLPCHPGLPKAALEKRRPATCGGSLDLAERQFLKEAIWKEMSRAEWERFRSCSLSIPTRVSCAWSRWRAAGPLVREIAAKLAFRHRCLFAMHLNRGLYLIPEDVDRTLLLSHLADAVDTVPGVPLLLLRGRPGAQGHGTLSLLDPSALDLNCTRKTAMPTVRLQGTPADIQLRKIGIAPQEEVRAHLHRPLGRTFRVLRFYP